MRKFLIVLVSMLFLLGFAASAFAIHADIPSETQAAVAKGSTQITLGGELRFRGWMSTDIIHGSGASAQLPVEAPSAAWYDTRVRLSLQADVTKNTVGLVQLETSSGGDLTNSDTYNWGGGSSTSSSSVGTAVPATENNKPNSELRILQAWIQHSGSGLLGIPAGIKVGHMPLALSQRQFLDHTKFGDDAVLLFAFPMKNLHVAAVTAKVIEGSTGQANDDTDAYAVLAVYNWNKDNAVGVNLFYAQSNNTPINTLHSITGATPTASNWLINEDQGFKFYNLGLHASGVLYGLTYEAEFDTQFGRTLKGFAETDFRGYGAFLNLAYNINPVTIRAGFAYGSGDKDGMADGKNKEFQTTMGHDVHYAFLYEYTIRTAANLQWLDPGHSGQGLSSSGVSSTGRSTGIANTTYYRLGLDFAPMKDMTASIDGFVIRASKTSGGQDKQIGEEIDVKLAYKIDRNLTYSVIAGWMNTGDFYETGAAGTPFTSANDVKDPFQMMHALTLSF
ncbi:MAG: alginate export family protein [Nitrospirales bacterium]|nr:alginate export family protein [Nitrospirales bacterium]